jgi:hypothetical protein
VTVNSLFTNIEQAILVFFALANIEDPGIAPDGSLATVLANKIESDPQLSARKLTYSILHWLCRVHSESLGDGCSGDEMLSFLMGARFVDTIRIGDMR